MHRQDHTCGPEDNVDKGSLALLHILYDLYPVFANCYAILTDLSAQLYFAEVVLRMDPNRLDEFDTGLNESSDYPEASDRTAEDEALGSDIK